MGQVNSLPRYSAVILIVVPMMLDTGCKPSNDDVSSQEQTPTVNIGKSTVSEGTVLQMTPVVHVEKESQMNVQFYIVNQSSKPAGYWTSWPRMTHTWHWELVSCRKGTAIERARATSAEPTKKDVRLLAPGESILCSIDLKDYLGDIPVGLYEFRVHYSLHKNDALVRLGCIPDEFDCTIMLVEVVE